MNIFSQEAAVGIDQATCVIAKLNFYHRNRKFEQTTPTTAALPTELSVGYLGPVPQRYTVVKYK
jgi:hypothetical protein